MPKYLITFEKGESIRWLGHLDILRTFERAIRRAGLPIAFTTGFNPRERLAFACALSTGITGSNELLTMEFTEPLPGNEIQATLSDTLPPGIRVHACAPITDAEAKTLVADMGCGEFEVICGFASHAQSTEIQHAIENAIAQVLCAEEVSIRREREGRTKQVNIRPNLFQLALIPESVTENRLTLRMIVGQGERGTAKPLEVIHALAERVQEPVQELKLRRAHRARLLQHPTLPNAIERENRDEV